jgi:hypothetical protein
MYEYILVGKGSSALRFTTLFMVHDVRGGDAAGCHHHIIKLQNQAIASTPSAAGRV